MKKFLLPALAATLLLAATAVAAPLDALKGMKGTLTSPEAPPISRS